MSTWPEILLFSALAILIGGGVYLSCESSAQHEAAHQAFVAECERDGKKHYECEAIWRGGEASEVAVPVVVPMPVQVYR